LERSRFADRHPYWFVGLLEIAVVLVYLVAGTVAHFLKLSNLALYGLANAALTVIVAVLVISMGWWRRVGFIAARNKRDLLWFLVPFLPMFINFIPGLELTSLNHVIVILVVTLMVGFVEEVIFRGLMLRALESRGAWRAIIVTSLLFGLTHALNVLTGKSLAQDAAQIFYAVAIGFAYAALVWRKGTIWPLVIAHFAIDFVNMLQKPGFTYSPFWTLAITLGIAIVFTGYGIFVMRVPDSAGEPPSSGHDRVDQAA
jgi:membrane protease YdiL (CAAX protease family)